MASSSSCCPGNSWGAPLDVSHDIKTLDDGVVRGSLLKIGPDADKLEIYCVPNPYPNPVSAITGEEKKKALVVFTDVYGLQNRLFAICDKLSSDLNMTVVAIDTFRGETKAHHTDDFVEWLKRHPFVVDDITASDKSDGKPTVFPVKKDIESCFTFLLETHGINSSNIGAIGFCWGVWALVKSCEMNLFQCGVGFHPSIKIESTVFGGNQEAVVKVAAENTPLLLCVAGNDLDNLKPSKGGALAQIIWESSLKHVPPGTELPTWAKPRCVEFEEMIHGWVSRGDTSIDNVKEKAESALAMAIDFINVWM